MKVNRIKQLFEQKKEGILNIYFTAGYPKLESTVSILRHLNDQEVDIVEVGMPYSDPMADGPTIQNSGQVALKNGMKLELLFNQIKEARKTVDLPIIMMGYFNQVMQYGEEHFFEKAKESGVDGLILPDLPLHIYEKEYLEMFESLDLCISFLISPQTDEARVRKIDQLSKGFIYMVSSASVTGAKSGIQSSQIEYFQKINDMQLNTPRLIGFGISDKQSFDTACAYANGAIIGSAYIKAITQNENIKTSTEDFISKIRNGKNILA